MVADGEQRLLRAQPGKGPGQGDLTTPASGLYPSSPLLPNRPWSWQGNPPRGHWEPGGKFHAHCPLRPPEMGRGQTLKRFCCRA